MSTAVALVAASISLECALTHYAMTNDKCWLTNYCLCKVQCLTDFLYIVTIDANNLPTQCTILLGSVLVGNYDAKVVTFNADGTLPEGTLMEPYMKPQTTGDRLVYKVALTDAQGQGWQIECPEGIYFSANRYTDEDFMNTKHTWELKARPYIWLQLGMDIRGLGNASCGPGPMQKYLIDSNQTYEFRVRMKKI